jgi:serine/threonine protein kinase
MLQGLSYDGLKTDIWSIGIILYAMCFGYLPFDNADSNILYKTIIEGKYEI